MKINLQEYLKNIKNGEAGNKEHFLKILNKIPNESDKIKSPYFLNFQKYFYFSSFALALVFIFTFNFNIQNKETQSNGINLATSIPEARTVNMVEMSKSMQAEPMMATYAMQDFQQAEVVPEEICTGLKCYFSKFINKIKELLKF
jgi:hypothetical protein